MGGKVKERSLSIRSIDRSTPARGEPSAACKPTASNDLPNQKPGELNAAKVVGVMWRGSTHIEQSKDGQHHCITRPNFGELLGGNRLRNGVPAARASSVNPPPHLRHGPVVAVFGGDFWIS